MKQSEQKFELLIVDFDNTLFDWFEYWYKSFFALKEELLVISQLDEPQLLKAIRKVYQKYNSSEYSFLIQEIPQLNPQNLPINLLLAKYGSAISKYRTQRKSALRLYPTVLNTLKLIKEHGVAIAVYTDSQAHYSKMRLKELQLDGVVDYLFSPPDLLSDDIFLDSARQNPSSRYELHSTKHICLNPDDKKPSPRVLSNIVTKLGGTLATTLYVGDSLYRDILMANEAGVFSVYAEYGKPQETFQYELLRQVSHWSDEKILDETNMTLENIVPDHTASQYFDEILPVILKNYEPTA